MEGNDHLTAYFGDHDAGSRAGSDLDHHTKVVQLRANQNISDTDSRPPRPANGSHRMTDITREDMDAKLAAVEASRDALCRA